MNDDSRRSEPSTERTTLKSRPWIVLVVLIGSCYAFGYTIFLLIQGMRR